MTYIGHNYDLMSVRDDLLSHRLWLTKAFYNSPDDFKSSGEYPLSFSKTISISQKGKLNVKIYPNPAKENITIDLGEAENATIRLVDILGKEILLKSGQSGQVSLNLSNLSSGVYFAEIKVKGFAVREKVVKN